ncbi:ABC transporter permease [Frankia sp. AgB32]|uniref:ABC transporter permease n=1 Tax=Frankia sp. AgB32 TaxID=631119 RepID=UPI00200DF8D7|nr:ABC transporter permease [Frankia sp. AgB32]MCK9897743.1 ABC transporter permease [Frankia sp. AgB32]
MSTQMARMIGTTTTVTGPATATAGRSASGPRPAGHGHRPAMRVTQLRVLRSEWTKLTSLRSTVWTLAAALGVTVVLGFILSRVTANDWPNYGAEEMRTFDATATSLSGMYLAQLAIGVLGVLVISGEYATGMIRASLGVVPRRLPVLWAKVAVFAAASFGLMVVANLIAFTVGQAQLSSRHIDVALSDPGVLRSVLGTAFFVTGIGVLGLALGALLRNTPAAIATLFGVLLVLPQIVGALPPRLARIGDHLPSASGDALMQVVRSPSVPSPTHGLLVLLAYLVVTLAAAAVLLVRRDA